jgi:hypothetical protein
VVALEQVLDATPEQLARLGAEGRARVQAQHDVRKIGVQLAQLMRGITGASPLPSDKQP